MTRKKITSWLLLLLLLLLTFCFQLLRSQPYQHELLGPTKKKCMGERGEVSNELNHNKVIVSLCMMVKSIESLAIQCDKTLRNPTSHQEISEILLILKQLKERLEPFVKEQDSQPGFKKAALILNVASEALLTLTGVIYIIYRMVHN